MSTPAIRFLQEESARLQKENRVQQEQILTLHRYINALAELHWAAQRIASVENPRDALDQCLLDVMHVAGAKDGSLSYLEQPGSRLVFIIVHGELGGQLVGRHIKSDVGVVGWAIDNREPVIVNNPCQDWRFFDQVDKEFGFLTRSILCVPVMRQDKPIGAIELLNKEHQEFSEIDVTLASILAHVAAIGLERLEAEGQDWIPVPAKRSEELPGAEASDE
jgi:GAF domain-containing protein